MNNSTSYLMSMLCKSSTNKYMIMVRNIILFVDAHFLNPYPKAHTKKSPMKSKTQRPTKKTKEQERSKERNARESNLQQNTDLPQNTVLSQIGRAHV